MIEEEHQIKTTSTVAKNNTPVIEKEIMNIDFSMQGLNSL